MKWILFPLSTSVGCCLVLCCVVLYHEIVENWIEGLKRMKEGRITVPKANLGGWSLTCFT